MKLIKATIEIGRCCVCNKRIRTNDFYYDLNGLWVHKQCWDNWTP